MIILIKSATGHEKKLSLAHLFSLLLTENMLIIRPDSTGKKGVAVPAASSSAVAVVSGASVIRFLSISAPKVHSGRMQSWMKNARISCGITLHLLTIAFYPFFLCSLGVNTFFQPSSVVSASRSPVMASPSAQVAKPYSVPVKVCYVLL